MNTTLPRNLITAAAVLTLISTTMTARAQQMSTDMPIANFGGFASPERTLVFDINDFDETFPGPWEWDVKRLGASLILAARDRSFFLGFGVVYQITP